MPKYYVTATVAMPINTVIEAKSRVAARAEAEAWAEQQVENGTKGWVEEVSLTLFSRLKKA